MIIANSSPVLSIKLEKHWQKWLMEYLLPGDCVHVVNLPDDNKKAQAAGSGSAREASSKPYDFGLLIDGSYLGVECKQTKTNTVYANDIRLCQHEGLKSVGEAGGHPFLALYYKFKEKGIVYEAGFMLEYKSDTDHYHYEDLLERSSRSTSERGNVACVTYGGILNMRDDRITLFSSLYPKALAQFKHTDYVKDFMKNTLHLDDEQYAKCLAACQGAE